MNISEIQKIVSGLTEDEFETLKIEQNLFQKATGLSDFNKYVRSNVKSKNGVYILFDPVEIKPIYWYGWKNKKRRQKQRSSLK